MSLISNTLHFDVQLIANIKCPSLYNNNHVVYMAYWNIQWKLSFWRVYISKQYKQLEIRTCRILSIWYEDSSIRFGQICAFCDMRTNTVSRICPHVARISPHVARYSASRRPVRVGTFDLSCRCWTILTLMNSQNQRSSPRELPSGKYFDDDL